MPDSEEYGKILLGIVQARPEFGGFLMGMIFSGIFCFAMARYVGLVAYERSNKEYREITKSLRNENKQYRTQIEEKDKRIDECHKEILSLRKSVSQKE